MKGLLQEECWEHRWGGGEGVSKRSFQRDIVRVWDLSGLKDIFQVSDQLVILSRSAKSEEAAVWWMRDGTEVGGIISNEIKRIFQGIWEIIDENQKKHRAKNTALRNSSLYGKRRWEIHVDCDRRGSPRGMSGDCLEYYKKRVWWAVRNARPSQKHVICLGKWL